MSILIEYLLTNMSAFSIFLIFSSVFAYSACNDSNLKTLQLVHVFFRHGSRTPEIQDVYPNDPYQLEAFQPMGYGQLTNIGKARAYKLGKLLRNRYDEFLGEVYTPDVIHAVSTDYDRTKMSVLLVLAGLFKPSPSQIWDEEVLWLPIPFHYQQHDYDYSLRRPTWYCPAYYKELQEVLHSDEARRFIKDHQKTFQYIEKHTGKPMRTLSDIFGIYQTLNSEESLNFTLPAWTKSVYPKDITALASKQNEFENYNDLLKKLNGGRMLSKVIKNIQAKLANSLQPAGRKMFLYSGHENNVINILSALNLFEPHFPKYSAAVIVELHHLETGVDAVKVYYSRDVDAELEEQKLEGCEVLCPLDKFVQLTQPRVPVNYTEECNSKINLDRLF